MPGVSRGSWTVFDAPEATAEVYGVFDAREASRADYGLSGRAMALTLADDERRRAADQADDELSVPQHDRAMWRAASSTLAELPIDAPVGAGDTTIELDRMVLGLAVGQPIALTGERDDLPGVDAAEIAILADIVHADGRTHAGARSTALDVLLRAQQPDDQRQRRARDARRDASARCSATATRRSPNQSFVLKKPPDHVPVCADGERRRKHARSARERRALGRGAVALRRGAATSRLHDAHRRRREACA